MNLDQFECLRDFDAAKFPISAINAFYEASAVHLATGLRFRHVIQNLNKVTQDLDYIASVFFKDKTLFSIELSAELDWRDYFEFVYISVERGPEFSPIGIVDSDRIVQKVFNHKVDQDLTKFDIYFWFRDHQNDALIQQTPMCKWGDKNRFCTYSMHGKFEPKENQ